MWTLREDEPSRVGASSWHLLDKRRHQRPNCWVKNNAKIHISFRKIGAESPFPLIKAVCVCVARVTCLVFRSYVDQWTEKRGVSCCLFSKSTAQPKTPWAFPNTVQTKHRSLRGHASLQGQQSLSPDLYLRWTPFPSQRYSVERRFTSSGG